jgi:monofunctional biosynthetic peptidoglycan transglycosylase
MVFGTVAVGAAILWRSLPDVAALAAENPTTTAFIERNRAKGVQIHWRIVPYEDISDQLKLAVLVAEDIGFFDHHGFDTREMTTALRDALDGKRLRGASTITQQLAKNLWLTPEKTPSRKAKEAILTWRLEQRLDKRRILELYLNVVEFSPGVYGAAAASQHFFGVAPADLDAMQSARLAAGLSRPSQWNPGRQSTAYARHVERILGRMSRAQWLVAKL